MKNIYILIFLLVLPSSNATMLIETKINVTVDDNQTILNISGEDGFSILFNLSNYSLNRTSNLTNVSQWFLLYRQEYNQSFEFLNESFDEIMERTKDINKSFTNLSSAYNQIFSLCSDKDNFYRLYTSYYYNSTFSDEKLSLCINESESCKTKSKEYEEDSVACDSQYTSCLRSLGSYTGTNCYDDLQKAQSKGSWWIWSAIAFLIIGYIARPHIDNKFGKTKGRGGNIQYSSESPVSDVQQGLEF